MADVGIEPRPLRVLYSFPHRIGAGRIALTAWHQAAGASAAGADVRVDAASFTVPLPETVASHTTLSPFGLRVPFRVVGDMRMFALHDRIVARRLRSLSGEVDLVHAWPLGARETLLAARELGIPTVLERPNAHTRYAYEVVRAESRRIGVSLPVDHEHAYKEDVLAKEEEEYALADALLCPSEFVAETFVEQGVPREKLVRHVYGFDEQLFHPSAREPDPNRPFTMLFVGVAAVRKGLHYALEAWLRSPAHEHGVFVIAGEILPDYGAKLADMLADPSVRALGHREDVPDLMRESDIFVLPSIEEGFGLTCLEAIGSGTVPLVSDRCTDLCRHMENALIHAAGDVDMLSAQITMLYEDPGLRERLRQRALADAPGLTWTKAGERLVEAYGEVAAARSVERA